MKNSNENIFINNRHSKSHYIYWNSNNYRRICKWWTLLLGKRIPITLIIIYLELIPCNLLPIYASIKPRVIELNQNLLCINPLINLFLIFNYMIIFKWREGKNFLFDNLFFLFLSVNNISWIDQKFQLEE